MAKRSSAKMRSRQAGVAAVEFALVSLLLFTFLYGAIETARALYVWSTLAEVVSRTARLAAVSSPGDAALVRHKAMFLNGASRFPLGGDIDETYLRVDYLAADRSTEIGTVTSPMENMLNCTMAPSDSTKCIRFVRVSLCVPGTDCTRVPYKPMVNLDTLSSFNLLLPTFSTVVAADSLGLAPAQ